ncbi:nitrate reductase molybdenum cofactor assembly chaperone [Hydromonas duriensis]|uniref:Respiratory nitrate reductase chaperone NarJ n=1 Tax=Hydromonas duriensis TaxID=1527608 RepID=A0A4V3DK64_9BURK|nr:nitrate reductase molybdenum cofactor assembly chaperone [Hydromonas duriensis]TDR32837.1 respiratory nitrate reductase chaperone NarJ [Hydromonas duriensis]
MRMYKLLSVLLCYPEPDLLAALPELRTEANQHTAYDTHLTPLLDELAAHDLITLQQNYVQTFDRTAAHSLHLFEHIHGEDRARGQAMVDLLEEYRQHGFDSVSEELPDYVPLFLEFLSTCDEEKAAQLLGDAIHVLAHVGHKLKDSGSVYAGVFDVLRDLSPVTPEPLTVPPIRDMDEALETFGPSADGVEPLLKPVAPINFYPQRPNASAGHQTAH